MGVGHCVFFTYLSGGGTPNFEGVLRSHNTLIKRCTVESHPILRVFGITPSFRGVRKNALFLGRFATPIRVLVIGQAIYTHKGVTMFSV